MPVTAHQARARVEASADISTAEVRPIALSEAAKIIRRYEWLGSMPAAARWAFGIFFDNRLGGAVVYGNEYAENRGVWDRYGYSGKIIALKRGVTLPWAHPHSASKLIRASMKLLPKRFKVVTATVCAAAGEIGTVYQSVGFDYVGQMKRGTRALIHYAGKIISERQAKRRFGTTGRHGLAKLGVRSYLVPRRSRYFAFRGDPREQESLRNTIVHRVLPYPKRHCERSIGFAIAPCS
jgi:hypothetical protein